MLSRGRRGRRREERREGERAVLGLSLLPADALRLTLRLPSEDARDLSNEWPAPLPLS